MESLESKFLTQLTRGDIVLVPDGQGTPGQGCEGGEKPWLQSAWDCEPEQLERSDHQEQDQIPDLRRADFGLFRDLLGKIPCETALEAKEARTSGLLLCETYSELPAPTPKTIWMQTGQINDQTCLKTEENLTANQPLCAVNT